MQEGQKNMQKNEKMEADVLEKDATKCINKEPDDVVDLNEEKSNDKGKNSRW